MKSLESKCANDQNKTGLSVFLILLPALIAEVQKGMLFFCNINPLCLWHGFANHDFLQATDYLEM